MASFLVVVQNLKSASSDMLDLCAKYFIRMLNYTPCLRHIISRHYLTPQHDLKDKVLDAVTKLQKKEIES